VGFVKNAGMEEIQTPEGRAKALAYQTWMNRAGGLITPAQGRFNERYRQGPQRGMTHGEAANQFEKMWREVSPQVREKYARQAGVVKPVEKRESAKDMYARQRDSRMKDQAYRLGGKEGVKAYESGARKPHDRDGNGVPDMIQRVPTAASKPTTMSFEQLTDPKQEFQAVGDGSSAATGWKPTVGEDGKPIKATDTTPGSVWGGINTMNDAIRTQNARNQVAAGNSADAAKIKSIQAKGAENLQGQGQQRAGDVAANRAAADAARSAETRRQAGLAPAPVAPLPTRPAASTRAQNIADSGGDMSKLATDDRVAVQGGVVNKTPPDLAKREPSFVPAAKPPRINSLTGLPFGARPGETTGLDAGQAATANRMAGERAAQGRPVATARDMAGADNAMRSQGMVVRTPAAKPVIGPARMAETPRSDGYVARGVIEAGRMQAENIRNDTTGAPRAVPVGASPVVRPTTQLQKPNRFALVRR
jgi:hypothetical protein